MPTYLFTILQILIVVIIIMGMIMVLLGINHLTHNDDSISQEQTEHMKEDMRRKESVITDRSVFHNFLARNISGRMSRRS